MTRFVLDKNPEMHSDKSLFELMKNLETNTLNSIMFSDSISKTIFLKKIIQESKIPIYYLDFDLLYSGYITSNITSETNLLNLYQPTKNDFKEILKKILLTISQEKSIIILDSLNGFFNLLSEKKDAGRLVNSYILLLSTIAKMSGSIIFFASLVKVKDEQEYVLSITGRHLINSKSISKCFSEKINSNIQTKVLDEKNKPKKIFNFPIESELI